MKTRFGSGLVLGGSHPDIPARPMYLTREADRLGKAVRMSRSNYVSSHLSRPHHQFTSYNYLSQKKTPSFTEAEQMGVPVPRRCERCKGCSRCSYQVEERLRQEEENLLNVLFYIFSENTKESGKTSIKSVRPYSKTNLLEFQLGLIH